MEGNAAASKKAVRWSQSLCAGEEEYVRQRKQVVLKTLSSLGINSTEGLVPHIALLPSGGGQRAAVSLMGSLYQMGKEGLLDTLLYLGGVSGSTWSMSSLYSDPQWSNHKLDGAVARLSGPGVEVELALGWLDERSKEEHFSLTDVWGVLTSAGIMKQMDLRCLSDEASRNASNPYPIYCAVEKHHLSNGPIEGKWFEVSPHEAGFPELGAFVETSLLGSRFQGGELLAQKPKMDMVQLQGVFGSALADEDTIGDFISSWQTEAAGIHFLLKWNSHHNCVCVRVCVCVCVCVCVHIDNAAEYLHVYNALQKLVAMTRSTIQGPAAFSDLDKLQKILLEDKVNHNESAWRQSRSAEERSGLSKQWSLELLKAVETWSQNLEDIDVSHLIQKVLPLILKWEWGTTANFLYQHQDDTVPPYLRLKETFHLIDAGLMVNTAYPSFLGDKRDIDLIIAPDFSSGSMFQTLTLARDYAAAVKKPFPEINETILEDRDWPKDCYVFEGKEKEPTIVYMPLFNRNNCKDAEEFKAKMEEYSTFQLPFNQDKIEFVLETAKANVKNNKETLLREINKAVLRRHN
ncbi:cytosolic phospholipase A2 gamma-like [Pagrus major]|uniref:cytosolic phospholipase A2 gamma-like n=1 Tax=Pagrus major TaxID=143350 RepID=UPI003CC8718B